jgi:hypothetical protein
MPDPSPIIDYASARPARKKVPAIVWWFLIDAMIFFGAFVYMVVAYEELEGARASQDLPPQKEDILNLWLLIALGLFVVLLGWAARGWWRSRRAG